VGQLEEEHQKLQAQLLRNRVKIKDQKLLVVTHDLLLSCGTENTSGAPTNKEGKFIVVYLGVNVKGRVDQELLFADVETTAFVRDHHRFARAGQLVVTRIWEDGGRFSEFFNRQQAAWV